MIALGLPALSAAQQAIVDTDELVHSVRFSWV